MDPKKAGGEKAPSGKAAKTAAAAPKAGAAVAPAAGGDTLAGGAASLAGAAAADTVVGGDTLVGGDNVRETPPGSPPRLGPTDEAARAIARAPIDPRPGSGSLDDRPVTGGYVPLSLDEIAALDAHLALLPAHELEVFRAGLAQAPIDPTKGQGTLDGDRRFETTVRTIGRLHGALAALAGGRAVPPVAELDARFELDPEMGPWLGVRATREGHRRAGRAWSTAATFVSERDLTSEQIEQLRADPAILIEDV